MNSSLRVFVLSIIFLRFTCTLAFTSPFMSTFTVDRKSRDAPINTNSIKGGPASSKSGMHKSNKYHTSKLHPQTSTHPSVYQSFSFSSPGTGPSSPSRDFAENPVFQLHQINSGSAGHSYPQPTTVSSYQGPEYHQIQEMSNLNPPTAPTNQNLPYASSAMKGYSTRGYTSNSNTYGPPTYGPPPVMQNAQYGPPAQQNGSPQSMSEYGGGQIENDRSTPVNFSAVGLLGLLAVMGMIQHVMAELDANIKPMMPSEDFETGNSMGGGSQPKPKPTSKTTTAKPSKVAFQFRNKKKGDEPRKRVKRNDIFKETSSSESSTILQLPMSTNGLPQNVVDNFVKFILPSYFEVASILGGNGNGKNYAVTQSNLQKAKSRAEKIVQLLVNEFNVPQNIAIFCVNHSIEVMLTQTAQELN